MDDDLKDIRLFTPEQTCELLKVGEKTLRRLTREGAIGHRRVGIKYMYSYRHIEKFVHENPLEGQ